MLRLPCPLDFIQPRQVDLQDVAIKKENCVQRLILRRGGDLVLYGEIAQKRSQLRRAHLPRVALAVKQNEPPDPLHVRLFGTDAVVPHPNQLAYLVQQTRRILARRRHKCLPWPVRLAAAMPGPRSLTITVSRTYRGRRVGKVRSNKPSNSSRNGA